MTIEITDEMWDAMKAATMSGWSVETNLESALQAVLPLIERAVRAECQEQWEGMLHEWGGDQERIRELEAELDRKEQAVRAECLSASYETAKAQAARIAELEAAMAGKGQAVRAEMEQKLVLLTNQRDGYLMRLQSAEKCVDQRDELLAQARAGGGATDRLQELMDRVVGTSGPVASALSASEWHELHAELHRLPAAREWTPEDARKVLAVYLGSEDLPASSETSVAIMLTALRECFPHRLPATQEPAHESPSDHYCDVDQCRAPAEPCVHDQPAQEPAQPFDLSVVAAPEVIAARRDAARKFVAQVSTPKPAQPARDAKQAVMDRVCQAVMPAQPADVLTPSDSDGNPWIGRALLAEERLRQLEAETALRTVFEARPTASETQEPAQPFERGCEVCGKNPDIIAGVCGDECAEKAGGPYEATQEPAQPAPHAAQSVTTAGTAPIATQVLIAPVQPADVLTAARLALDAEHNPHGLQPTSAELLDLVNRLASELAQERERYKTAALANVERPDGHAEAAYWQKSYSETSRVLEEERAELAQLRERVAGYQRDLLEGERAQKQLRQTLNEEQEELRQLRERVREVVTQINVNTLRHAARCLQDGLESTYLAIQTRALADKLESAISAGKVGRDG